MESVPIFLPAKAHITTSSLEMLGAELGAFPASSQSSLAWPATDRTYYLPVRPMNDLLVKRLFCVNGSTATTNTITMGLYDSLRSDGPRPGTKIVSASATASGANVCQYFDIADTWLTRGEIYWLSIAMNGTTATNLRYSLNVLTQGAILVFQSAANTPTNPTIVVQSSQMIPAVGLDLRGTP